MAPFRHCPAIGALAVALVMSTSDAFAITAKDVMEKMTEKQRFGYITGLVDMLSYQHLLSGNRERAQCISNAFYGRNEEAWHKLVDTFGRYPDKAPEGLVVVLMKHACGS
jgi:hypothetical protein